jgi:DNA-directed RNA polymerase subunit RPC12/RpoP
MPVRTAFCTTCNRDVHLSEPDEVSCPVCSSPLIETESQTIVSSIRTTTQLLGPEVYLG